MGEKSALRTTFEFTADSRLYQKIIIKTLVYKSYSILKGVKDEQFDVAINGLTVALAVMALLESHRMYCKKIP